MGIVGLWPVESRPVSQSESEWKFICRKVLGKGHHAL